MPQPYSTSRQRGEFLVNAIDDLTDLADRLRTPDIGHAIYAFAAEIFSICRSITGDGVRETLGKIRRVLPLDVHEVPTGTPVLDWVIPREWNIRDAYIKNTGGEKVVDFKKSNLHIMSYSVPVRMNMSLAELKKHLYSLPDQPDVVPYRTSYYSENWGFCLAHRQLESLREASYEVVIDSTLENGSLTYGEYLHKGETEDEFLFSTHICHPSLANDNCSGLALLAHLANRLRGMKTRYSYRFLFTPGTIGGITWLARNEARVSRIKHGLVVSMVGDAGGPTYKRSRRGDAKIDRAVAHVLSHSGLKSTTMDFIPYGYDERQFCSPGFNLPVGLFQRSKFEEIPEYHTSADNLDFIRPEHLATSYSLIASVIDVIENDLVLLNAKPKGEPQLGKYGLYEAIGGGKHTAEKKMAMLWLLNLGDGAHSLLDIAERARIPFALIRSTAQVLRAQGLLT